MDNLQCNGASAPPAEEQVQRVEETIGDPQGGNLPGAGTALTLEQTQTAQNTAQEDAATPFETRTRQCTDAEKQRAAKGKEARVAALAKQERERQQGLLTLIRVAIKKCIEWRLQVQIALFAEVNLAPSRPE
jgi:hypothetical protein